MLTAFACTSDTYRKLKTVEELHEVWAEPGTKIWADLENPTAEDILALHGILHVDEDLIEDALEGEQRPRVDDHNGHFSLIFYGARSAKSETTFSPRKVVIHCGDRFLITLHAAALASLTSLRKRFGKHCQETLGRGTDAMLYAVLDQLVDNYEHLIECYEDRIEQLEDESLLPEVQESILSQTSDLRREVLHLRRLASAQREVVLALAKGKHDHISPKVAKKLSHVHDHLVKVEERIEMLRDLLHTVRDNYHAMLAARTNAIMRHLTLFATFLMPLTLIAGIYGMNVRFYPRPETERSFWVVMTLMAVVGGSLLLYFRRRKWL